MKQEGLLFFTDTWLTLIGLVIFFSFFVYMIICVYKSDPNYIKRMSNIPLNKEGSND